MYHDIPTPSILLGGGVWIKIGGNLKHKNLAQESSPSSSKTPETPLFRKSSYIQSYIIIMDLA